MAVLVMFYRGLPVQSFHGTGRFLTALQSWQRIYGFCQMLKDNYVLKGQARAE